jgi:hypothetical protein
VSVQRSTDASGWRLPQLDTRERRRGYRQIFHEEVIVHGVPKPPAQASLESIEALPG